MTSADETAHPDVITKVVGGVGRLTLNRPGAMNALTLDMVRAMTQALETWARDRSVQAVVVDAAGDRAFCAGGDIRLLRDSLASGDDQAETFWREEYRLNRLIHRFEKPYVALVDGVTMGGGVGVSIHGSHRVAGDRTVIAMPETGIGLIPDVGGTFVLPRLPGRLGVWMGLTGARMKTPEALACGLATHFVPSDRHAELIATLERADLDPDGEMVETIIDDLSADPGETAMATTQVAVDALFDAPDVAGIVAKLEADDSPWAEKQAAIIRTKSPMSLAVAHRALTATPPDTIEEALSLEFALITGLFRQPDFAEGVRAVIVDKDNAPAWSPGRLEDVDPSVVEALFAARDDQGLGFEPVTPSTA